jgi:hypothetical protein
MRHPGFDITVLVSVLVAWLIGLALALRAFWRTSEDPRKAKIYAGAKFWGIFVSVFGGLSTAATMPLSKLPYLASALIWTVVAFPICLAGGYVVIRVIVSIVSREPLERD